MLTCLSLGSNVFHSRASCVFFVYLRFFKIPTEGIGVVAFFGGELFLLLCIIIQFVSHDPS